MRYDRKKFRHVRLAVWLVQLPVLGTLLYLHASDQVLLYYGLVIAILTGVEANLPSEGE